MRLLIEFIKKTSTTKYVLFTNITRIFTSESYYSYGNQELFQNSCLRIKATPLSSCSSTNTYSTNPYKEYILPSITTNYGMQSLYRPSCIFESEFTSTCLPGENLKTLGSEPISRNTKVTRNYNTTQCQTTCNIATDTYGDSIINCNTERKDSNQCCYASCIYTVNSSEYNSKAKEPQKLLNGIYPDSIMSYRRNKIDPSGYKDVGQGRFNYYDTSQTSSNTWSTQERFATTMDRIHINHSSNPTNCEKTKYSDYNEPLEDRDFNKQNGCTVVFPALESTDYIFSEIGNSASRNYKISQNKQPNENLSCIQTDFHDYSEHNDDRTPINGCPYTGLSHRLNFSDGTTKIISDIPGSDLCFPSLTLPNPDQDNTKTLQHIPYILNTQVNPYTDIPLLKPNTIYSENNQPINENGITYNKKRTYNSIFGRTEVSNYSTLHGLTTRNKRSRRDSDTIPPDTDIYNISNTPITELDYERELYFTLQNCFFAFKRNTETNMDKTIILNCYTVDPPQVLHIAYEQFLHRYIYGVHAIDKFSFSYRIPIFIPLNFKTRGPLKYFKLISSLKKHDINQTVYGIAYFFDEGTLDAHSQPPNLVLQNTIPADFNNLIQQLFDSKFPMYDLSSLKYNDILSFKAIVNMSSRPIISIKEFYEKFLKGDLFSNYYKKYKCKYNNILDIPIRPPGYRSHYRIIEWKSSIYLINLTTLYVYNEIKKIEEVISNPNMSQVSMKREINQHIRNIIFHTDRVWNIKYTTDKGDNYEEEVGLLSYFMFLNRQILGVLKFWNKYIFTDEVIEFIENEH